MKTSVLIQSLARWIFTKLLPRWSEDVSKLRLNPFVHAHRSPLRLFAGLALRISHHPSASSLPVSLSLPRSLFSCVWHPEMNRRCHRDSCSLSAFKQTVSNRITFTGNLPVWGEGIGTHSRPTSRLKEPKQPQTPITIMCIWICSSSINPSIVSPAWYINCGAREGNTSWAGH